MPPKQTQNPSAVKEATVVNAAAAIAPKPPDDKAKKGVQVAGPETKKPGDAKAPVVTIEEPVLVKKKEKKKKKENLGIEKMMAQVQRNAIPKCKKDKVLVEPYDPPAMLWWNRPVLVYAFNHPKVRSRLERLMGSNLVRLTDRKYMLKLHDRILEDYINSMNKRIAAREAQERNREKELVLTGKIPLDKAPAEMASHPILLINNYCQKLIAERRAKIKVPKVHIPLYLYLDDTPDPPPGLSIIDGHVFRKADDLICIPPDTHLAFTQEEDIERGYMFTNDEFEKKQKYESDKVKELANVETVEQMYTLADEIIGPLKTIKEVAIDDESMMSKQ